MNFKKLQDVGRCRYINPYTDFGFRRFFGTEENKELLISFLNSIVVRRGDPIVEVSFPQKTSDEFPDSFFDVLCRRKSGDVFVAVMQNAPLGFTKDLSVFHLFTGTTTFSKTYSGKYPLNETCLVALTNQTLSQEGASERYLHEVMLMDVKNYHVFYKRLLLVYLEMPKFEKHAEELRTMGDKWLFALKNLPFFREVPKVLNGNVFEQLFEQADLTRFTDEERLAYQRSLSSLGR